MSSVWCAARIKVTWAIGGAGASRSSRLLPLVDKRLPLAFRHERSILLVGLVQKLEDAGANVVLE